MQKPDAWYLHPIVVLALLFLVLGPFALPLLFRSRGFSPATKFWLAAAVIFYTAYLVYIAYRVGMGWGNGYWPGLIK